MNKLTLNIAALPGDNTDGEILLIDGTPIHNIQYIGIDASCDDATQVVIRFIADVNGEVRVRTLQSSENPIEQLQGV